MIWPASRGPTCTFEVSEQSGEWKILRDAVVEGGRFHSRGDAVRVACFRARAEEKQGGRARVIAPPDDLLMPHYEPHFGL